MKRLAAVALVLAFGACSGPPSPIIDLEGRDPVQANRDMAWCQATHPAFAWGNPIATCMRDKGYTLMGIYSNYNKPPAPNSSTVVVTPE